MTNSGSTGGADGFGYALVGLYFNLEQTPRFM
jgi:hypothetical protein